MKKTKILKRNPKYANPDATYRAYASEEEGSGLYTFTGSAPLEVPVKLAKQLKKVTGKGGHPMFVEVDEDDEDDTPEVEETPAPVKEEAPKPTPAPEKADVKPPVNGKQKKVI